MLFQAQLVPLLWVDCTHNSIGLETDLLPVSLPSLLHFLGCAVAGHLGSFWLYVQLVLEREQQNPTCVSVLTCILDKDAGKAPTEHASFVVCITCGVRTPLTRLQQASKALSSCQLYMPAP